ncbi:MAG: HEAT repeat domain-containing protein [Actinobacteria bacterium]|nr:HEAT repeat domain-containing protein [Actinomycetota bacterium]MCG2818987.1 HEAT repeat domain-containing protein [Actinomycetes bacterium]MBU4180015.1 HEAT repeat domain-containing protein [Actinomycetota bacterium]MBU4217827.1 HEAT repeat domain-containing protein [Actinomycetota bacterium]MBU4359335.1 HEAT repeat domain-containing protein [Actinomycetota bacterium]
MDDDIGLEKAEAGIEEAKRRGDAGYLLKVLAGPSRGLRVMAVRALGEVGGKRARMALASVARDRRGEGPDVRLAAIESLGGLYGDEAYASFLEEFIADDNKRVVNGARRVLSGADPDGYPMRLLSRGCLDHQAIGVYGRSRLAESVPLLGRFLEERAAAGDFLSTNCWGKVYVSVRALGNIGGEDAVKALSVLLGAIHSAGSSGDRVLTQERADKIRGAARAAIDAAGKG